MRYLAFLIYIIIWDAGLIVGTGYVVFVLGASPWWWLLTVILVGASFKPGHFGIEQKSKPKEKEA